MLSQVRRQIQDDEVHLPEGFRFLYKDTKAPITEKQEMRYPAKDCLSPNPDNSELPILRVDIVKNSVK